MAIDRAADMATLYKIFILASLLSFTAGTGDLNILEMFQE
jgi:hypothetical protein